MAKSHTNVLKLPIGGEEHEIIIFSIIISLVIRQFRWLLLQRV